MYNVKWRLNTLSVAFTNDLKDVIKGKAIHRLFLMQGQVITIDIRSDIILSCYLYETNENSLWTTYLFDKTCRCFN